MSDLPTNSSRPSSGVRPRGPLVLVAEGDDGSRDLFARQLAQAGFMVLEAEDGAAAIEKTLQFGPHAIVLDMALSGVDGLKVARRLRADDPDARARDHRPRVAQSTTHFEELAISRRVRRVLVQARCDGKAE